jgi:peptide deformylase
MIQPIFLYGNEVLKEKSGEIPKNFPKLHELIDDMFETMHRAGGIGLSGIQIGVPLRIFVVEAHIESENFHFRGIFINPYIRKYFTPFVKYTEGCLSVPYISSLVDRHSKIEIEYYDEKWEFHVETFDGYRARIIQHEYDHLEGILYVDKIDELWKKTLEYHLDLIEKREIEVKYLNK